MSQQLENLVTNARNGLLTCKKCGCQMIGYPGDDECSDCAWPMLAEARKAAVQGVSDKHFERTGERVNGNELMRRVLFR
jgi:hypothetical protein